MSFFTGMKALQFCQAVSLRPVATAKEKGKTPVSA